MGDKDKRQREYLSNPNYFADLMNGCLFDGVQVVKADSLVQLESTIIDADASDATESISDIVMRDENGERVYSIWILENQEYIDYGMVVRVLYSEAVRYHNQLKVIKKANEATDKSLDSKEWLCKVRKSDRLQPITTLVVYWGEDEWDAAVRIHELLDFGDDEEVASYMKQFVKNYDINLIDLSKIKDLDAFHTSLKHVIAFYQRRNDKDKYLEYYNSIRDLEELDEDTQRFISKVTKDTRLLQSVEKCKQTGGKKMCKATEGIYNDGVEAGIKQGIKDSLHNLMKSSNMTIEQALLALMVPKDEWEQYM